MTIETEYTPKPERFGYDGYSLQEFTAERGSYMDIAYAPKLTSLTKWGTDCKHHRPKSEFRITDRNCNVVWTDKEIEK